VRAGLATAFAAGEAIRFSADVVGFDDTQEKVRVKFQDGDAAEGDLFIGADGLRSAVRRQLLDDGLPVYLGSTIWRGVVSNAQVGLTGGDGTNWVGRGGEFLDFHMVGDRIYWAGVAKAPEGERPDTNGHKADLLRRFGDWDAPVRALISATDEDAILRNDMYDRPPARTWTKGRVTLIGDAAHPMTPNAGQGANQALEDAVALGESLAGQSDIPSALMAYQQRRLRRANRIVRLSHQATRGTQIENVVLSALRDSFARHMPRGLMLRMMDATISPSR
jgi:2-polyprenyl-6-methoxyphenol hydroxylase-like FAD-dependent oxidoreductase